MTAILLAALAAAAPADDKGKRVPFTLHVGHVEKTTSGLKGDTSFLLVADRETFDKYFGLAKVMGPPPRVVPEKAFETKAVVAVLHRDTAAWSYLIEGTTADGDTLTVTYKATRGKPGPPGTPRYSNPMILTVAKGIKKVVFVENGKEAGTAEAK